MEAFDINKVLENLSIRRPAFRNKADFRDSLSSEIYKMYPSAVIDKNHHVQCDGDKLIDLMILYDNTSYYLRLYHKIEASGNNTNENDTMYDFWAYVSLFERITHKADGSNAAGFVILLTDAHRYWTKPEDTKNTKRANTLLYDKREVKGLIKYQGKDAITIRSSYKLSWRDYFNASALKIDCTQRRYLCVAIPVSNKKHPKVEEINSFNDFINVIPDIDVPLFYRGQAGLEYLPLPAAIRSGKKQDYESDVFMSVLTKQPDEYIGIANLQKLAKLQHKSQPTRLLDVSVNPLVALFFAVSSIRDKDYDDKNKDKDGWVFRFNPIDGNGNPRPIRLFDSDTCKVLAALAAIGDEDKQELRYQAVMDYFIQCYIYGIRKKTRPGIVKYSLEHKVFTVVLHILFQNVLSHISEKNRWTVLGGNQFKPFSLGEWKGIVRDTKRLALKGFESYISSGEVNSKVVHQMMDEVLGSFRTADDSFKILDIEFSCCRISQDEDQYAVFFPEPIDQIGEECLMQELIGDDPADQDDSMPMYINPETGEYYCYELMKLYGKVTNESPAFKMCTYPLDLLDGSFVRPIFNSDRMVAQQGSFMMFGLSDFWDVRGMIRYLLSQKKGLLDILRVLILNDVRVIEVYDDKERSKNTNNIIQYLINVLGAEVWKIPSGKRDEIKRRLRSFGISKDTLGRSEETTVYEIDDY